MKSERKYNLEDRLIEFAIMISEVCDKIPGTRLGNQIGSQLIRSGTSPALNYGEALGSESTRDFIHKLKIVLKELRESFICLKIIQKKPLVKCPGDIQAVFKETDELIAIFVKSIDTAKKNMAKNT